MSSISSDEAASKLFHAILSSNASAVRDVLLMHEDVANASFPGQDSFLHLAASEGNAEIVALLIEFGANVNQASLGRLHCPPLCEAAESGHADVVRVLLSAGAWVDGEDRTSITPLMLAAREGHDAVVELLLDSGADVNRLGYVQRFFALDFAGWHGTDSTKALLRSRGGKSVTDEFDWKAQSGYPIIAHVSNEAGPVYPMGFERSIEDRNITLRLAYVNVKEEPLVLFTAEIHQMGALVEYVVNLPHRWPLKQTYSVVGGPLSFPMDVLQRLATLAASGTVLHEGSVVLRDDPLFADLGWPAGLSALIALDHDWEAASVIGRKGRKATASDKSALQGSPEPDSDSPSNDDEVSILTLAPILEGEKLPVGVALSKWLEKKRTAAWVKLCLPLRDE